MAFPFFILLKKGCFIIVILQKVQVRPQFRISGAKRTKDENAARDLFSSIFISTFFTSVLSAHASHQYSHFNLLSLSAVFNLLSLICIFYLLSFNLPAFIYCLFIL